MTGHSGFPSTQGVLDQPSQHELTPVNLQELCLLTVGDESALLMIDC